MIFPLFVFALMALSFVVQKFLPSFDWASGSTLLLVPTLFFCAAATLSFPVMLVLAFLTGLVWDADMLVYDYSAEQGTAGPLAPSLGLPFGYSIFLFGLFGMIMQGIRPLFKVGKLGLPILMVGLAVVLWRLAEYLIIVFRRGDPSFSRDFWEQILGCAFLSLVAAPILLLLLHRVARLMRHQIHYEGVRFHGH